MEAYWILSGLGFLVIALLMLYLGKELFDLLTPYSFREQLIQEDNPAFGLLLCGYLLGILAVLGGVFQGGELTEFTLSAWLADAGPMILFGFVGIACLVASGWIQDRVTLKHFVLSKEITERKNAAVGILAGSGFLASGLVIAGGIHGSPDLVTALVAFAAGQICLVFFAWVYQRATVYHDQEELGTKRNLAVGIAFSGQILAYSILLMRGLSDHGDGDWAIRGAHFAYYAVAGAVLLPLLRKFNDHFFLPGVSLDHELVQDRNLNAGMMEATLSIAAAGIIALAI